MAHNIDNIIEKIYGVVMAHKLENDGEYARWLWQNPDGTRDLGLNAYGCADAANILYTIGRLPNTNKEKDAFVSAIKKLQNPETGLFSEGTHHSTHTTAHCIAALELFDEKPDYPLNGLMDRATKEGLYDLLEGLPWETNPWDGSHQGAGIFASLVLTDSVDLEWQEAYFEWLKNETDPETGFFGKSWADNFSAPPFYNIGSTFHYLFNVEHKNMPIYYPEKLIDSCLEMYYNQRDGIKEALAPSNVGFSIVDWIFCMTRASRQTSHKFEEIRTVLREFADKHIKFLDEVDEKTHDGINDIHGLFGCVCGLAELQKALPGYIKSTKPLKLVLDRRPFI